MGDRGEMQMNFRKITLSVFVLSLFLCATSSWAQSSGSIEGVVKDASGGVLSNATVEISNPVTGLEISTVALDKTPPEASFTTPSMLPDDCAQLDVAHKNKLSTKTESVILRKFICISPLSPMGTRSQSWPGVAAQENGRGR